MAHVRRPQNLAHRAQMRQSRGTEAAIEDSRAAGFVAADALGETARLFVGPKVEVGGGLRSGGHARCYSLPASTRATASRTHGSICKSRVFSEARRSLMPQLAQM